MEFYNSISPTSIKSIMSQIPLVKNDSEGRLKHELQRNFDELGNRTMQRAAVKAHDVKLNRIQKQNLKKFTKERLQVYKEKAMNRYGSKEQFGGARLPNEIAERN